MQILHCMYLWLLISMLWHKQAIFKSKGDKLSSSAECRFEPRVSDTKSPADWMPADKPTELSRIKLKTWTRQPSLWSASIQPTWPHCQLAFAPGSGDIHVYSNRKETCCLPLLNADLNPGSQTPNRKQTESTFTLSRIEFGVYIVIYTYELYLLSAVSNFFLCDCIHSYMHCHVKWMRRIIQQHTDWRMPISHGLRWIFFTTLIVIKVIEIII